MREYKQKEKTIKQYSNDIVNNTINIMKKQDVNSPLSNYKLTFNTNQNIINLIL